MSHQPLFYATETEFLYNIGKVKNATTDPVVAFFCPLYRSIIRLSQNYFNQMLLNFVYRKGNIPSIRVKMRLMRHEYMPSHEDHLTFAGGGSLRVRIWHNSHKITLLTKGVDELTINSASDRIKF